jgi:hypothetical protein
LDIIHRKLDTSFFVICFKFLAPSFTVCLVGEPRERSGADPYFGDGSNPS